MDAVSSVGSSSAADVQSGVDVALLAQTQALEQAVVSDLLASLGVATSIDASA